MDNIAVAYGYVLRRLRKSAELSQEELAYNCGLDRTFISLLERGERQPSITTVFLIARQLQVTPADFISQVERAVKRGGRQSGARLPSARV